MLLATPDSPCGTLPRLMGVVWPLVMFVVPSKTVISGGMPVTAPDTTNVKGFSTPSPLSASVLPNGNRLVSSRPNRAGVQGYGEGGLCSRRQTRQARLAHREVRGVRKRRGQGEGLIAVVADGERLAGTGHVVDPAADADRRGLTAGDVGCPVQNGNLRRHAGNDARNQERKGVLYAIAVVGVVVTKGYCLGTRPNRAGVQGYDEGGRVLPPPDSSGRVGPP